jgi:uncharacterized membrane protein
MSLSGLVLGIINAAIVAVVLLLVGALIVWVCQAFIGVSVPDMVRKLYIALVALLVLYYIVAALFGFPSWGPIRG